MFTSDKNVLASRLALRYLAAALFVAVFCAVYEHFSFGVYSWFMVYAFAFPLVGGTLPYLLCAVSDGRQMPGPAAADGLQEARLAVASDRTWLPGPAARGFFHAGIATLTVGSIVAGVVEIYGTTNRLTAIYWLAGALLLAAGLAAQKVIPQNVRKTR